MTLLALAGRGSPRLLATVRSRESGPDAVTGLWKDGGLRLTGLAPLDRADARRLLGHHLGGEVADATAELMWQLTRGHPLHLIELARFGRAERRLCRDGDLWLWQGPVELPAALTGLLDGRLDGLPPDRLDALGALALAQPLSLARWRRWPRATRWPRSRTGAWSVPSCGTGPSGCGRRTRSSPGP